MSTNSKIYDKLIGLVTSLQSFTNKIINAVITQIEFGDIAALETVENLHQFKQRGIPILSQATTSSYESVLSELTAFAKAKSDILGNIFREALPPVNINITEVSKDWFKASYSLGRKEVGFLTFGLQNADDRWLKIGYIEVSEAFRSKDIGTALLQYSAGYAKTAGYEGLWSSKASRLPESVGFFDNLEKKGILSPDGFIEGNPDNATSMFVVDLFYGLQIPTPQAISRIVSTSALRMGEGVAYTLDEIFEQILDKKIQVFEGAIKLGVINGKTTDEVIASLKGTRALDYKDGILNATNRQMKSLVRTSISAVSNQVADRFYRDNGDILKGLRWTSTLDGRTTSVCRARDGQIFPLSSGPRPPAHIQCRSFMAPITKSWKELGIHLDEVPKSVRASMDGEVPEDLSYGDWLKSKPESFVRKVLGPARSELFLSGKASMSDFVNDNGHELSLEELKNILT